MVNYGGKWDIVQAVKKLTAEVVRHNMNLDEINEDSFSRWISTHDLPDPDLLIRTSGELRISNFFLWQLAYTELYFTEVHWPDFGKEELQLALDAYNKRQRRFGQLIKD